MYRGARLSQPLHAVDDWYATNVIDGTTTETTQEWHELLQQRRTAAEQRADRSRVKRALARGPIPDSMRAEVWLTFTGAGEQMAQHPDVYEQLVRRVAMIHKGKDVIEGSSGSGKAAESSSSAAAQRVLEQVEKDLRRTEVGTDDGDKLGAMRRVLCAFASFKPEVGYVQGMNFIAVALLHVFDEPAAFWMLALIVQDWLPEHFSTMMIGNHVDCRVLATLTSEHLPRMYGRLGELDVTVQLLTTRWFLCLWSSVLPPRALHRLWDFLFVMGPAATMQARGATPTSSCHTGPPCYRARA